MIPKIIHYCWFGRKPMPEMALRCVESWKKYLPDYQVMRWDEQTYDYNKFDFTREAYEQRKFAFVTDVVRLEVLYRYGGIYMDTDVEVLRPLDPLLELHAFSGFESNSLIPTGLMASHAGAEWLKSLLHYYERKHFIRWNGKLNKTPNTLIITRHFRHHLQLNNQYQVLPDQLHIFPSDYFCPKSYKTGEINLTPNTYCIHHFAGSWIGTQQGSPWLRILNRLFMRHLKQV